MPKIPKVRSKDQKPITSFFGKRPAAQVPGPSQPGGPAPAPPGNQPPLGQVPIQPPKAAAEKTPKATPLRRPTGSIIPDSEDEDESLVLARLSRVSVTPRASRFKDVDEDDGEASLPKPFIASPVRSQAPPTPRPAPATPRPAPSTPWNPEASSGGPSTPSGYTPAPKSERKRLLSLGAIEETPGSPRPAPSAPSRAEPTTSKPEVEQPRPDFVPPTISAGTPLEPGQRSRCPRQYVPKIEEALKTMVVKKVVPAPASADMSTVKPLEFLYTDPRLDIKPGRAYQPKVVTKEKGIGQSNVRLVWELRGYQQGSDRGLMRLSKANYTQQECMTICQLLVDALNRWPDMNAMSFEGTMNNPSPLSQILFRAAVVQAFPDKPVQMTAPQVIHSNGILGYSLLIKFPIIDSDNLKSFYHTKTLRPKDIDSAALIPQSENIVWCEGQIPFADTMQPSMEQLNASSTQGITVEDQEGLEHAERYARYVTSFFIRHRSPLLTKKETKAWLAGMLALTGAGPKARIYSQSCLFLVYCARGRPSTSIWGSDTLKKNSGVDLAEIYMASADMAWANIVLTAANKAWIDSNDIKEAWRALAKSLDEVNERIISGEPSPSTCTCTGEQERVNTHECVMCGRPVVCERLLPCASGGRACKLCLHDKRQEVRRPLLKKLRICLYPYQHEETSFAETLQWVSDKYGSDDEGNWYTNAFSGARIQSPLVRRHPLLVSSDAIFPFIREKSGRNGIHTIGNIATIPLALNLAKHVSLPIVMGKISKFMRDTATIRDDLLQNRPGATGRMEALQHGLVEDCHRYAAIRSRVPHSRAGRRAFTVSDKTAQYLRDEWVSGRLHLGVQAKVRTSWQNSLGWFDRQGCQTIANEIQRWTGVELPKQGGCPYFAHPASMPTTWDWSYCRRLMQSRHHRMKTMCNREDETVDTAETIYLECIFQVCIRKMVVLEGDDDAAMRRSLKDKYAEFLGLPLDIEPHNALTFAVAHRVHGMQMRTGWPPSPRTLADRIDAENNILIETRTSNFAKNAFAECYYPTIYKMMSEVWVPRDLADETMVLGAMDPQCEAEIRAGRALVSEEDEKDEDGEEEAKCCLDDWDDELEASGFA